MGQQVRSIARRMVAQWGFSFETLGAIAWEGQNGNGMMEQRTVSKGTEKAIDEEVTKFVDAAYAKAYETLSTNRALMDDMVKVMLDKETIDYNELIEMRDRHCRDLATA